jgi:hypothetical protein
MIVGSMQVILWIRKQLYVITKILYYGKIEQKFHLLSGTEKHVNNHAVCVRQIKTTYIVLFKLLNQNYSHRYNLYISTAVTMYYTIHNIL